MATKKNRAQKKRKDARLEDLKVKKNPKGSSISGFKVKGTTGTFDRIDVS